MITLHFILLILAAAFFFLAAVNVSSARINFVAAGLFCWVISLLV